MALELAVETGARQPNEARRLVAIPLGLPQSPLQHVPLHLRHDRGQMPPEGGRCILRPLLRQRER